MFAACVCFCVLFVVLFCLFLWLLGFFLSGVFGPLFPLCCCFCVLCLMSAYWGDWGLQRTAGPNITHTHTHHRDFLPPFVFLLEVGCFILCIDPISTLLIAHGRQDWSCYGSNSLNLQNAIVFPVCYTTWRELSGGKNKFCWRLVGLFCLYWLSCRLVPLTRLSCSVWGVGFSRPEPWTRLDPVQLAALSVGQPGAPVSSKACAHGSGVSFFGVGGI